MGNFLAFPDGFVWGVATSGHQIEGNNRDSDWWHWEQEPGRIKNNEKSGKATDHWERIEEDIVLLKKLNIGAYRFSVEWSRLEPSPGEWDVGAFEHYRREIDLLIAASIEPVITLNHFTIPQWLASKGGWEWEGAASAFERFAREVFQKMGLGVRRWITLNEPMVTVALGYLGVSEPRFPPGKKDPKAALRAMDGMLRAHSNAYRVLHEEAAKQNKAIEVGIAHHFRIFDPATRGIFDRWLSWAIDRFFNWSFFNAVQSGTLRVFLPSPHFFPFHRSNRKIPGLKGTQDFIGLNYYTRDRVRFGKTKSDPAPGPKTEVGWEIYPEGLYRILKILSSKQPTKPIFITENGVADQNDFIRTEFIRGHLKAMHRAISEGSRVAGFFYWSFLDNFEWIEGFGPRFGLYEVDFQTLERTPRPSAVEYAEIARSNSITT